MGHIPFIALDDPETLKLILELSRPGDGLILRSRIDDGHFKVPEGLTE
jgi:hypothetical protein